jgi:hypothetical protein
MTLWSAEFEDLFPKRTARMVIQFDWYSAAGWQPVFFVLW